MPVRGSFCECGASKFTYHLTWVFTCSCLGYWHQAGHCGLGPEVGLSFRRPQGLRLPCVSHVSAERRSVNTMKLICSGVWPGLQKACWRREMVCPPIQEPLVMARYLSALCWEFLQNMSALSTRPPGTVALSSAFDHTGTAVQQERCVLSLSSGPSTHPPVRCLSVHLCLLLVIYT